MLLKGVFKVKVEKRCGLLWTTILLFLSIWFNMTMFWTILTKIKSLILEIQLLFYKQMMMTSLVRKIFQLFKKT